MAAQYEPKQVDISICVDDTLCKGVESWAWYGLQPINAVTKPGGTLIVTSNQKEDELVKHIHRRETPYKLAIIPGEASFAGLWVYKNDGTDAALPGRGPQGRAHHVLDGIPGVGDSREHRHGNARRSRARSL